MTLSPLKKEDIKYTEDREFSSGLVVSIESLRSALLGLKEAIGKEKECYGLHDSYETGVIKGYACAERLIKYYFGVLEDKE